MTREPNDTARAPYAAADLAECEGAACRGGHGERGRSRIPAGGGARICPDCVRGLTGDLARLPQLYDECGLLLDNSGRPRERTSGGGGSPGLPFNAAAAETRSVILGVLRSWAGLVVGEWAAAAPPDTAAGIAEFLTRHSGRLAAHDRAAELSQEVRRALRRAQFVIDPPSGRSKQVGTCVVAGCEGALTAVAGAGRAGAPVEISCAEDPLHRWSAREWMALSSGAPSGGTPGPALPEPPVRWLSARDISLLWGIPSGSVYRHASEQQWRRRTGKGRTFYHEGDVLRFLGARTSGRR